MNESRDAMGADSGAASMKTADVWKLRPIQASDGAVLHGFSRTRR